MDPLAQLRDIHLPDPVSPWPPAPGWWILACLILIGLVVLICYAVAYYKKNRYRRLARKQLIQLYQDYQKEQDIIKYSLNINKLLKQVSVIYYKKTDVSRLSDSAWLTFLDSSGNTDEFSQGAGQVLATLPYAGPEAGSIDQADAHALYRCCAQWIRKHK